MSQITQFVQNNAVLVAAFVGLTGAIAWTFVAGRRGGVNRLSPVDATRLVNAEDGLVLDVRGDNEFKQGHIINSMNISESQVSKQMGKLEKYKQRPVVVVCRSGQSSAKVAAELIKQGFEKVNVLAGGLMAWESASLPLTKK